MSPGLLTVFSSNVTLFAANSRGGKNCSHNRNPRVVRVFALDRQRVEADQGFVDEPGPGAT